MIRHIAQLTLHDLRVRRTALIGWGASLALTMIAFVAMFPSIAKIDYEKIAAQYPEDLMRAFGVESLSKIGTPGGFLDLELFGVIMPLALIFLPIGMIAHAITNDEENGYLTPLLALPIARRSVMAAGCLSAVLAHLLAIVAIVVSAMAASVVFGVGLPLSDILRSSFSTLPLGVFAAGIAALAAGISSRRGLPTALAAGTLVAMYLLQVLAGFSGFFHNIRGISVFNYYNQWINGSIDWLPYFGILSVSAALMFCGGRTFARRDIRF